MKQHNHEKYSLKKLSACRFFFMASPQKKLSFSFDGEMKVNNTAINIPIIKETILELSHFLILFPTKNIEIKIRPKKKAHINKGKLLNKYLNRLAKLKTLTMLPPKTEDKK